MASSSHLAVYRLMGAASRIHKPCDRMLGPSGRPYPRYVRRLYGSNELGIQYLILVPFFRRCSTIAKLINYPWQPSCPKGRVVVLGICNVTQQVIGSCGLYLWREPQLLGHRSVALLDQNVHIWWHRVRFWMDTLGGPIGPPYPIREKKDHSRK